MLCPAVGECHVLALNKADFFEAFAECGRHVRKWPWRPTAEESNHRDSRLLRADREWPRGRRAAKQCDELAPSHLEHGLPSGTRRASLPHAKTAMEVPAGPWAKPETF
jgi:hypothetical protein